MVFGVQMSAVSLIDFVNCEKAKNELQCGLAALSGGDLKKGFEHCAIAFDALVMDYEGGKGRRYRRSPFLFGTNIPSISPATLDIGDRILHLERLDDFARSVQESIEAMRTALKILGFGLDYRRYVRFEKLTPVVIWGLRTSAPMIRWHGITPETSDSAGDLEFCIDFVMESALRLQEFDYEDSPSRP